MFSTPYSHAASMHGMWPLADSHPTVDNSNNVASDLFGTIGYAAEPFNLPLGGTEWDIGPWWHSQSHNKSEATLSDESLELLLGPEPEKVPDFVPFPDFAPAFDFDPAEFVAAASPPLISSPLMFFSAPEPAPHPVHNAPTPPAHPLLPMATVVSGSVPSTVPSLPLPAAPAPVSPITSTPSSAPTTGKRTKRALSDSDSAESSQTAARPAKKARKSKAVVEATDVAATDNNYASPTVSTLLHIMQGFATKHWSTPREVIDLTTDEDHPTILKETTRELGEFTKRVLAESVPKGARGGRMCGPAKFAVAPTPSPVLESRAVSSVTAATGCKSRATATDSSDGRQDAVPAAKRKTRAPRKKRNAGVASKGKAVEGKDGSPHATKGTATTSSSNVRAKGKRPVRNVGPPTIPPPVIAMPVDFIHRPRSSTSASSAAGSTGSSNGSTASAPVKSTLAIPMPVVASKVMFDIFSQR
ncbi:hypothetical protein SCP_1005020 [Sparassis crispa]|uniref:Uncharacterized protein n=1 Tax=Sparassis crispa TaxID=139825 RepID=A0A401GYL7_9APHY|nr:hypothetical protein SCP_1005020 [Sparassis crispa]GBE87255.1 hypothetical protein SCP_1005020 [Sparassis crispa]